MAQSIALRPAQAEFAPPVSAVVAKWLRSWTRDLFDPYRPERHYMRGPGPKWHAKHGHTGPAPAARLPF